MAGKVAYIKVFTLLKLLSGLAGNYHAPGTRDHYAYTLPLFGIKK